MVKALVFMRNDEDIVDGIDLRNGKGNGFGWSIYQVWYVKNVGAFVPFEEHIADLYCGEPTILKEGYTYRFDEVLENA